MNIELFKDAIAIIAGIPEDRIDLASYQGGENHPVNYIRKPEQITCDTICCAGGWLALHPQMQAHGIRVFATGMPTFKASICSDALAFLFDIPCDDAAVLFDCRQDGETGSDRQIWLDRAYKLLEAYKAPQ